MKMNQENDEKVEIVNDNALSFDTNCLLQKNAMKAFGEFQLFNDVPFR